VNILDAIEWHLSNERNEEAIPLDDYTRGEKQVEWGKVCLLMDPFQIIMGGGRLSGYLMRGGRRIDRVEWWNPMKEGRRAGVCGGKGGGEGRGSRGSGHAGRERDSWEGRGRYRCNRIR
jgi:hypothetical protein